MQFKLKNLITAVRNSSKEVEESIQKISSAKVKTIEDLDKIIDLIIQKEDNPKLEKNLVIFWKGIR